MKRVRTISFILAFLCFFQWQAKHKAASGESIGLSIAGLACTAGAAVVEGFTQQWYLAVPAAGAAIVQTIDIFRIGKRKRELLKAAKMYVRFGWLFLGVGIFAPRIYRWRVMNRFRSTGPDELQSNAAVDDNPESSSEQDANPIPPRVE